ncbi:MAG: thymidylate synthase [Candidatus Muirbacterium halophilum]|nr:thymidylate synthase [Candidatus Muirbacterium halophilum]
MIKADKYFKDNLLKIKTDGTMDENPRPKYKDNTLAYSKFITQVFEEYDLQKNEFPITTLRNTAIKTGINEILWIYQKQTNSLEIARSMGIRWWDEWNIGNNTIGVRYGETVRRYDLINKLLKSLKDDPFSRRHIINLYQEVDLQESKGLYPCAYETMWSVRKIDNVYYLDLTLNQRSSDYLVANYINKIQYVALQMMIASHLGYELGKFCHYVQNLHIYDRHIEAQNEMINRTPIEVQPIIKLKSNKNFYEFTIDDFIIENIEKIEKINSPLELAI